MHILFDLRSFARVGLLFCGSSLPLVAQSATIDLLQAVPQADRVVDVSSSELTTLSGHRPVWVDPTNLSLAQVDLAEQLRLVIVLRRSPAAEQAFKAFLEAQQSPGSPLYHKALSPMDQGSLYGPTQHDIEAITEWAMTQGLTVGDLSPSRTQLRVTGSATAVSAAFRVHFSMYNTVHGVRRGPDTDPQLPSGLSPVIDVIVGLTPEDLYPQNAASVPAAPPNFLHAETLNQQVSAKPLFTGGKGNHFITPADFAAIYDVTPAYTANNNGAMIGSAVQHVAIVANSTANLSDIQAFFAGIGTMQPTYNAVLADATSPGASAGQGEAELDIERVLGTAPGVTVDLVEGSGSTPLYDSASYAVNTLKDPIVTMSFGTCEPSLGAAGAKMWSDLWMTAAAKMTSVFVSGGDAGAAACDTHDAAPPATATARAISGIASTPYNTAVGGTEFADAGNPPQYWSTTNDPTTKSSALGYIPEGAWNDPTHTDAQTGNTVIGVNAGGGGASMYNPKPSWQTGTGVPATDNARDTPDISFSGSYFHDAYYYCGPGDCTVAQQSNPSTFVAFGDGGTSATAPTMAGIAALLNSAAGSPQGLLNPTIYRLANSPVAAQIFHDVTAASSGVSNCDVAVPSLCNNSIPTSTSATTAGTPGFVVGTGYDQATGWGSLDVANFIRAAVPVNTSLKLAVTGTAISTSQTITATATLTASSTSLAPPTGTVQFFINGTASGSPVTLSGGAATSADLNFPVAGNYMITAMYSGDALYVSSTSASTSVVVTAMAPGLSLTASSSSLTFTSGAITGNSVPVTIASTNNFTGTVALTCSISTSSAAFQPTCAVTPATTTLPANGTSVSNVIITSTTAQAELLAPTYGSKSRSNPIEIATTGFGAALAFMGLCLRKRRVFIPILALTLMFLGEVALLGCSKGNSAPLRSSAGTYTVTVSATGNGAGSLSASSASTTIAVNIQ